MSKQLDWVRTNFIKTLLLSQTTDNTELVVEKMAEGNLNKILLSYLTAIALKHPQEAIRKKAQTLLEQRAPLPLKTHLQSYLGYQHDKPYFESNELYAHSNIYFFDAILAEKMIFWHHQVGANPEHTVIRLHYLEWEKQHVRIAEIPFVDTIVLHKVQKFDFKSFMKAIKPMKITYIHFYHLYNTITPIDMKILCNVITLKILLFNGDWEQPVLNIPKNIIAPIHLLCIRQCKVTHLENLAPYIGQFTHLLIE